MEQAVGDFERDLNIVLKTIFGTRYVSKYKDEEVIEKSEIDKHLDTLFKDGVGFILSGGVGVGKTMALIYIYKKIIEELSKKALIEEDPYLYQIERYIKFIQFFFAPDLFARLHQGENIRLTPFIIIDDLGREYAEPFSLSQFESFIESVYRRVGVSLIITTNLNMEQFKNRDGWLRIVDRLMEICGWLEIKGKSRRHK